MNNTIQQAKPPTVINGKCFRIGTFLKGLEIINGKILLTEDGKLLIN